MYIFFILIEELISKFAHLNLFFFLFFSLFFFFFFFNEDCVLQSNVEISSQLSKINKYLFYLLLKCLF